ncbi:hypothetical protein LTR35_017601 [Friedmanniomyces endolithicus]|nr:hypothetical protein LTR35_017601 [Friedmanniomyces endolithicus]KAK0264030.1 hypothetical protein LTS00_018061 [Friedmanniomyces endolithicus]KAK0972511.1 hypothetical protein LTR54_017569 [Friedmanniomyces endolithicus]
MTVYKQRFFRWNFFFVNGLYYDLAYILFPWKLGVWELRAKMFVFQEVYETLLYLLAPFVLPISLIVRPLFCLYLLGATLGLYYINATIFNEVHLRLRKERVGWVCVYLYYMPYKIVLTVINVFSCYYSLFKYARYFAKRHPKVIEDEQAVGVVLRLEEQAPVQSKHGSLARIMTVTASGTKMSTEPGRLPSNAAVEMEEGLWARGLHETLTVKVAGGSDVSDMAVGTDRLNRTQATDFATNGRAQEARTLRTGNTQLLQENDRCCGLIETLLRHPAFTPFIDDISKDTAVLGMRQQQTQNLQATQQQQQQPPATPMQQQVQPQQQPQIQQQDVKPEFMNFDASQLQIPSQQTEQTQRQMGLAMTPEENFSKLDINGFWGVNFNGGYSVNAYEVTEVPNGPDPVELLVCLPARLPAFHASAADSTVDLTVLLAKLEGTASRMKAA